MVTIKKWGEKYNNAPKVTICNSQYVEGVCEMISGEKMHFAKVGLDLSPAATLAFDTSVDEEVKKVCIKKGWFDSICYGVLDVMLIGPMTPINHFNCLISRVEIDLRRSSRLAFRFAARKATQHFLTTEPYNRIYGWGYNK